MPSPPDFSGYGPHSAEFSRSLGCRLLRIHQFPGTLQLPGALQPIPGTPRPEDCLSQRKVPRAHGLLRKNYEPVIANWTSFSCCWAWERAEPVAGEADGSLPA
jgi:hypothetical protein